MCQFPASPQRDCKLWMTDLQERWVGFDTHMYLDSNRGVSSAKLFDNGDPAGSNRDVLSLSVWHMKIPLPPLQMAASKDPSV